jgi:hypothetical protein
VRECGDRGQCLPSRQDPLACRPRRAAGAGGLRLGRHPPAGSSYAPSPTQFQAANHRLAAIDGEIARRLRALQQVWESAPLERVLHGAALVEREIDRARRAPSLFFEVFSQRGSAFAPVLAAHDAIAADLLCGGAWGGARLLCSPRLKPLTYMQASHSPAMCGRRAAQPAARRVEPVPADPRPVAMSGISTSPIMCSPP